MAFFDCIVGGSGKGNTLVVTCADDLAGATITCTNGTKTYTKTCPSTSPYEVTFYGLMAGTWTVSATVSGNTYTTTVVVVDCAALLGGFNWRTWVDTAQFLDSSDYDSLSEVLEDELAIRELCLEHACVDYLADIATTSADVETIINNDLFAKWVNNSDYALDFLGANAVIKALMDEADKYGYGEWVITDNTTTPPTWGAKGNVPVMTANNAPYGQAIASTEQYPAWRAFSQSDDMWYPTTSDTVANCYIGYKFDTPVSIKEIGKFYMHNNTGTAITYKVQASNTGNADDWIDASEVYSHTGSSYISEKPQITIDGSYLYWRLKMVSGTPYRANYGGFCIKFLQFYGRELSVSVPVMTGNTTPYGEASADSYDISSSSYPYYAFSNGNNGWYPNTSGTHWLMYDFGKIGIVPKRVTVKHLRAAGTVQLNTSVIVSASNDNNQFTEIGRFTIVSSGIEYVSDNITSSACRYIKVEVTGDNIRAGQGMKFQFYGLDYSEKEFETGTTKKWLYDHGVEVVAIDAMRDAGSKQSDCLNVAVGSSSANNTYGLTTPTDAIDLTPYSLIRAKVGKSMVGTIQPQASTQKTSYDSGRISYISIDQSHNKAMIPNDLTLDISSVNQNAYPNFIVGSTNMNTDIAEWWLE